MASDYEWPAELQAGVMWGGEIRRATYTLNDAARAWQAFRDFLNGVGERGDMSLWQAHSMAALERGYAMREHKR